MMRRPNCSRSYGPSGPAVQEKLRRTWLRTSPAAIALPIRLVRGGWPSIIETALSRFIWSDPRVVRSERPTDEQFRKAMSAFWFRGTYKITSINRHPEADQLLVDHVESIAEAHILDIGASDGSTSLDLISRLPGFARYTISDRFIATTSVEQRGRTFFFDPDRACCLIASDRLIMWPTMSPWVELISRPLRRRIRSDAATRSVVLLNPAVQDLLLSDDRVSWVEHDVFQPWVGPQPDVIKIANLLRRLYFNDELIGLALRNLLVALPDGGHLLIADNSRIPGMKPRAGLYRRTGDRFLTVAETDDIPEISDLVVSTRLHAKDPGVETNAADVA